MKFVVCPSRLIVIDCQEKFSLPFFVLFLLSLVLCSICFRSSSFLSLRHWEKQKNQTTVAVAVYSRCILYYTVLCVVETGALDRLLPSLLFFSFFFFFFKCKHLTLLRDCSRVFHTGPEFPVFHAPFRITQHAWSNGLCYPLTHCHYIILSTASKTVRQKMKLASKKKIQDGTNCNDDIIARITGGCLAGVHAHLLLIDSLFLEIKNQ